MATLVFGLGLQMFGLLVLLSKFEEYVCFIIVMAWYSLFKLIELILRTVFSLPDLVFFLARSSRAAVH